MFTTTKNLPKRLIVLRTVYLHIRGHLTGHPEAPRAPSQTASYFRCVVLVLSAVFFISSLGCARSVRVEYSAPENTAESLDLFHTRVEVQSPPQADRDGFKRAGFLLVGFYNNWEIDFATELPDAVADALSYSFANVDVHQEYRRDCDHCGLIIRPKVTSFSVNVLTLQSIIELETKVYDPHDKLIATFLHEGRSPVVSTSRVGAATAAVAVPFGGSVVGNPVVKASVQGALEDAIEQVRERYLREVQAGGELARVWRPKKKEYGAHEFVAEKTATRAGCNLRTDGIDLVSERYGKEVYNAYCWNVGTFTIDCEFGRCQANLESDRALAAKDDPPEGMN